MAWEYLEIEKEFEDKSIRIWPPQKVDLQWLSQQYPSAKISSDKPRVVDTIECKNVFVYEVFYLLVEYLCSSGWEPFVSNGEIFERKVISFKRQVHDKE